MFINSSFGLLSINGPINNTSSDISGENENAIVLTGVINENKVNLIYGSSKSLDVDMNALLKDSIKETGVFNIEIKLYEGIIGKVKIDIVG